MEPLDGSLSESIPMSSLCTNSRLVLAYTMPLCILSSFSIEDVSYVNGVQLTSVLSILLLPIPAIFCRTALNKENIGLVI